MKFANCGGRKEPGWFGVVRYQHPRRTTNSRLLDFRREGVRQECVDARSLLEHCFKSFKILFCERHRWLHPQNKPPEFQVHVSVNLLGWRPLEQDSAQPYKDWRLQPCVSERDRLELPQVRTCELHHSTEIFLHPDPAQQQRSRKTRLTLLFHVVRV